MAQSFFWKKFSVKLEAKYNEFHARNAFDKYRLQHGSHFVRASLCLVWYAWDYFACWDIQTLSTLVISRLHCFGTPPEHTGSKTPHYSALLMEMALNTTTNPFRLNTLNATTKPGLDMPPRWQQESPLFDTLRKRRQYIKHFPYYRACLCGISEHRWITL